MGRVEGKKQALKRLDIIPTNKGITNCNKCNGKLVKLETTTTKHYSKKEVYYYDVYWICLCTKCRRRVKVKETTYKVPEHIR